MIRYATIGTSSITENFIKATEQNDSEMTLAAVYSRSREKGEALSSKHGDVPVFCNMDELLKSELIDAVYIASPNALHYEQAFSALLSGKHVLCEKPAVVEPWQLEKLLKLAETTGLIFMEALIGRHIDTAQAAVKDALKRLGRISHVRLDFSQRASKYNSFMMGNHENIFDPKMATGALMDLGVYCVYPMCDWFGVPKNINAWCTKLSSGADGEGGALFGYSDFSAVLTYSKTGQSSIGSEIIGDNGTLVIPFISKLTDIYFKNTDGTVKMLTGDMDKPTLMSYEARDFCRYINGSHLERYRADSELALDVCRVMKEIRNKAGIKFGV